MDTVTNTERRHAGWLAQQRQEARPTDQVPTTVTRDGARFPVLAAVHLPAGYGTLPAHVVLYRDSDDTLTVHTLVLGASPYLHQGEYGFVNYRDAVAALLARVERELGF